MWIPNAIFAIVGLSLLTRMERPGDRDLIGALPVGSPPLGLALRRKLPDAAAHVRSRSRGWRMFLVPQVVDALRSAKLPVLLRAAAGQFRADDARL